MRNSQKALHLLVTGPTPVTKAAWDRSYNQLVRFLQETDLKPVMEFLADISQKNHVSLQQLLTIAFQLGYQTRILESEFDRNLMTAEEIVNNLLASIKRPTN